MKKILIITGIVIGILFLFTLSKVKAENYLPLLGKVIVIDPGHGEYLYPQKNKIMLKSL